MNMAVLRAMANTIFRQVFLPSLASRSEGSLRLSSPTIYDSGPLHLVSPVICNTPVRCAAYSGSGEVNKKAPSRLAQMQQLLVAAQERAQVACEPIPQIALDHVAVSFARSGGPGGQNVNKVNTKVDMRFNVKNAYWLPDRVRERILQMEKNRINKDGELVISSTKTRTQKGNIEDALGKLQAIINEASYVPPAPSEEQVKKIAKMAAIGEQKRLQSKKAHSQKKASRRSRASWD